jgi:DNA-binding CsgD family transcriptional regulator
MTEHVMFAAAIKAERLRLMARIERDRLLLEAVEKIDALYRHFDDIAPAAEDDRTEFERVTNPESDAPAPLPASVVQAAELTDTVQRSAPAKQSAEEPLSNGSGEVQDECAIHLPNNSNNAPAEDARLEDGLSPSKEGDTTSAATDGIAGTSVSSTDPDGGGSNSPETANQSAGGAVAAVTGANAQLADAVGVEPLPADTNPLSLSNRDVSTDEEASSGAGPQAEALQSQGTGAETLAVRDGHAQGQAASAGLPIYSPETANEKVGGSPAVAAPFNAEEAGRTPAYAIRGRSGTSPDADVTAGETAINSAAAAETGKPAGETDGSPAAPVTKKERVAQTHQEHPGWTTAQIATHLNLSRGAVSGHLHTLGIKLGHKGSPRKKAPGEPTVREKVLALHSEHPDWPQKQIADALGIGTGSVSNAVKGLGLEFPKSANSLPKADSQRARVEAYLDKHPGAVAKEVSAALGIPENAIRALAAANNFSLGRLSPEENRAAKRAGGLKTIAKLRGLPPDHPASEWAESRLRKYGAPEPAPDIEPAPQPFTAGDQDEEPIAPAPRPRVLSEPKGRFYLRTAAGKYLHMSGSGLVDGRSYAWCGNQKQFEALRDKFEMARDPAFVKYVPDLPAVRA